MKIRTAELQGTALDWAVAKAWWGMERVSLGTFCRGGFFSLFHSRNDYLGVLVDSCPVRPSTSWKDGGPIIEREWITLTPTRSGYWGAEIIHAIPGPLDRYQWLGSGSTPLIAAMRCYVTSKLGDEIDVPEELCND